MGKNRLEAFSDGVLAILITIMVLELKRPTGTDFAALRPLFPVLLSYVLSFIYIGIYWNNYHHLFHATKSVNGAILWANLHLLFWLSLFPFATAWIGETHVMPGPTSAYGVILLMAGVSYYILQCTIMADQGPSSLLRTALGYDWKGKLSPAIYLAAIPLAYVDPRIAIAMYWVVALIWIVPDRRIERILRQHDR
jgi:uncharacterized membrane protein